MKLDSSHIKKIFVVSNTHWDREFRRSFEKTRRRLLDMLDITLEILDTDPKYHSFTMDGHSIMIDDYLEIRPEKRELVEKLVRTGKLIIGPWYTLAEQFSISHEPLIRNLLWGRKTTEKYGGKPLTVAYTPASWGQSGQLPQILADFGIRSVMFYRGISHHESDAEFIWEAPDGTRILGSRFAIYARYNWYYQVHRPVTKGNVFSKEYVWGKFDEVPVRFADGSAGEDLSFELTSAAVLYNKEQLRKAIEDMVAAEGKHFTTPLFLAMNGHDISVAYPLESKIIDDAKEIFSGIYTIEHTDLESYWCELEKHLNLKSLAVLKGERRSHLKEGMWTFLFPATISARVYLKQQDFASTVGLVHYAEPLASMAYAFGANYPTQYIDRAWKYLLSNHTHDANGGCAPDSVCKDMEYRYRKVLDIADIVTEDSIKYVVKNLSPDGLAKDAIQLVVFNSLPWTRDALVKVDIEIPRTLKAAAFNLEHPDDPQPSIQHLSSAKSSCFVDSIWDVPTILDSTRVQAYVYLSDLPALGYRSYIVKPRIFQPRSTKTLICGSASMENEFLHVTVNSNATIDVLNKKTKKSYLNLNYLTDEGEVGNAWRHVSPSNDRKYCTLGVCANIAVTLSGELASEISAEYIFSVPGDYGNGCSRSERMVDIPVRVIYRLEKNSNVVKIITTLNNTAQDHWLRANFPTAIISDTAFADSHFDIVERPVALPDSTGWVEQAVGTHPLRTMVGISDGKSLVALFPKGLFEYEVFEDKQRTIALTLLRCCRIKLAVSEEKQTELPDEGVQCPGWHRFEYALMFHEGNWADAGLLRKAAELFTTPRCVISGRGKGKLPLNASLFSVDNSSVAITAVKKAESSDATVIRLFNPTNKRQDVVITVDQRFRSACLCRMDESIIEEIAISNNGKICYSIGPKKIITLSLQFKNL